jgi:hypothetical protein
MKRLIKSVALIVSSILVVEANAQNVKESEVPISVKSKFVTLYPNAKNVRWEKENGNFEAEFKAAQTETSVLFDSDGTHLQTEVEIPVSNLPNGVKDFVRKNLSGKKISEATRITAANGNVTYEAEIGGEDFLFDANGNFLKKEKEVEDDEDDN